MQDVTKKVKDILFSLKEQLDQILKTHMTLVLESRKALERESVSEQAAYVTSYSYCAGYEDALRYAIAQIKGVSPTANNKKGQHMETLIFDIPVPHLKGEIRVSVGDENGNCPGVYLAFVHNDRTKKEIPLVVVESEINNPNHRLSTYIYSENERGGRTNRFDYFPIDD